MFIRSRGSISAVRDTLNEIDENPPGCGARACLSLVASHQRYRTVCDTWTRIHEPKCRNSCPKPQFEE